jgi:predicted nucleic acid-binding protein
MNIVAAFADVERLYVDTAPLIYYVEENPDYIGKMDYIIDRIEDVPLQAISAVITLTEVLNYPLHLGHTELEQAYRNILMNSSVFRLESVTVNTAESAARLRARYNLRTPDALYLATALETDCDAFLTNDVALKRVHEIRVLVLDELELGTDEDAT